MEHENRIVLTFFKFVPGQVDRISNLSWMKWDQVGQVEHGISAPLDYDILSQGK